MYETDYYFILSGPNFSPCDLEQLLKVKLEEKIEPGEICKFGRYKNKLSPGGRAILRLVSDKVGNVTETDILTSSILKEFVINRKKIEKIGVEDMIFHIDIAYKDQCNIEISNVLLKKLYELNVPVTITCYESDKQVRS
jgi:hypothetical protein